LRNMQGFGGPGEIPVFAQGKHLTQEADINRHAARLSRLSKECIGRMPWALVYFNKLGF